MIMEKELIIKKDTDWYQELLEDLKKIEFTSIVIGKLTYGNRILKDFKKFEQGEKRVENIARDLKVSVGEIYSCIKFAEKVRDNPEFYDNIRKLQLNWFRIVHDYLYLPRKKEVELLPLPKGKYNIIYADPSWKYWGGGYKNQSQHYDVMNYKDMMKIPVQDIAADNCILFMWATFPAIEQALELIKAWGFKYSTVGFTWVKSKKDRTGFAFGCGYWTRANAEICLIATKGTIERKDASISQIIYEPKQEHSKKPDIVRDKIVQLVGDLPRIELFARQKTEGWKVWGNEV